MQAIVCAIAGFLIGSIPIGLLVGRAAAGIDIRRYGTGNIGASNTFHNLGIAPAAVVGLASFLQGFGPAWLADRLTGSDVAAAAAGAGSVVGYAWSIFLRLRGGSAVGAATGALAFFAPWGLVPLLGCYAVGGVLHRSAISVLIGLLAYLVYIVMLPHPLPLVIGAAIVVAVVVLKRLDGIRADLREEPEHAAEVLLDRLLNDRKPDRQSRDSIGRQAAN